MSDKHCNECDTEIADSTKVYCYSCYRELARELDSAQDEVASLEDKLKDAEECLHTEADYGILLKEARELELENIELKHQIKELQRDQSGKKI